MNNVTKPQRLTPLSDPMPPKVKRTGKRVLTPAQKKSQEELLATWNLLKSIGVPLDAPAMSLRGGFSKSLATQYLNGHAPLNTDRMLWFATEMGLAPQEIWPDWEWHQVTGSPTLIHLLRRWAKLEISTRSAVNTLIKLNGALRYDHGGAVIYIVQGTLPPG